MRRILVAAALSLAALAALPELGASKAQANFFRRYTTRYYSPSYSSYYSPWYSGYYSPYYSGSYYRSSPWHYGSYYSPSYRSYYSPSYRWGGYYGWPGIYVR